MTRTSAWSYDQDGAVRVLCALLASAALMLVAGNADAARVSDIRNTKHNLSKDSANAIKATNEDEVCVYCHTPHGSTTKDAAGNPLKAPLWNRTIPAGATYSGYGYLSSSLDAQTIQTVYDGTPGGSSKLCLSCHDGTIATGQVNVLNGTFNASQIITGLEKKLSDATSPAVGSGSTTGFTRNLGSNLSNDHPISVTFTETLATRDTELREVDANQSFTDSGTLYLGVRKSGVKPKLPLEPTDTSSSTAKGQVQCASCHDPHLKEKESTAIDFGREKFLRLPRFQKEAPTAAFSGADIICRVCHNKDKGIGTYAYSAHANSNVATQTYAESAAIQRDFPTTIKVWQASCLNCHDPHTVEGSRRLLREGTDSTSSPKAGGTPAIEQTCYQCHSKLAESALANVAAVPNIKDDFALVRRMPITSADQGTSAPNTEMHDIGRVGSGTGDVGGATCESQTLSTVGCGADMIESQTRLGNGALTNRHAECTDCHNPHRVMKMRLFYSRQNAGNGIGATDTWTGTVGQIENGGITQPDAEGTHLHYNKSGYTHTNIISGVLRGAWGVEPVYGNGASFHVLPSDFDVKRGDPATSTDVTSGYVTREYQICLKCHSNYGYADNNTFPGTSSGRPSPGTLAGTTPSGAMGTLTVYDIAKGLTTYTNQAKEFQAPSGHNNEPASVGTDGGAIGYNTNNHRSWHPVMAPTGRTTSARNITSTNPWRNPFATGVGTQTMYCTDCHGSNVTSGTSVIPDGTAPNGNPWGPHGSANNFILKGVWGPTMGGTSRDDYNRTDNFLCFKCHDYEAYISRNDSGRRSGFYQPSGKGNLHNYHVDKIQRIYCTWCHVAVPHGWKNKSLLVNLNDVGHEAGQGVGSSKEVATNGSNDVYTRQPYYLNAKLKVRTFQAAGSWNEGDCGSAGKSGTGLTNGLIAGSGGTTNRTGSGIEWMTNTCSSPP